MPRSSGTYWTEFWRDASSTEKAAFGISYHCQSGNGDAQAGSGPAGTGTTGVYGGGVSGVGDTDVVTVVVVVAPALTDEVPAVAVGDPPPPQPVTANAPNESEARNSDRRDVSVAGQESMPEEVVMGPIEMYVAVMAGVVLSLFLGVSEVAALRKPLSRLYDRWTGLSRSGRRFRIAAELCGIAALFLLQALLIAVLVAAALGDLDCKFTQGLWKSKAGSCSYERTSFSGGPRPLRFFQPHVSMGG